MENKNLNLSVRELVEFSLRSGSIDSTYFGASKPERAKEGSRLHRLLQKKRKEQAASLNYSYEKEVYLKYDFILDDTNLSLEGRADGIFAYDNGEIVIEEIKSTLVPLAELYEYYNELHWAQAKCYSYIFCKLNNINKISTLLTYIETVSENDISFKKDFTFDELEIFFNYIIQKYFKWYETLYEHSIIRDESIKKLEFPFEKYRKGQRDVAVAIYKTITQRKKIFAIAPTGTGKTISALFPSIKSLAQGHTTKIFYLTAKTITRQAAVDALKKMELLGLNIRALVLTSKEKICSNSKVACNPTTCKYADGHFDRVNAACEDIFANETIIERSAIQHYALKHCVCPYEFSLDVCLSADCIICDYNYVFDPTAYLRRFFEDAKSAKKQNYIFLIDEAHNLLDRSRDMYSAKIGKNIFSALKKAVGTEYPHLRTKINKIIKLFGDYAKKVEPPNNAYLLHEPPTDINSLLISFAEEANLWMQENENNENYELVLDAYFQALNFNLIFEFYDEHYVSFAEKSYDTGICLFCIDPSFLLADAQKKSRSTVFFSATLTPIEYYKELLGGGDDDYIIKLHSPFENINRSVIIESSINTRYKYREKSYGKIADYLHTIQEVKPGNYMIFFPSYEYLTYVLDIFIEKYPYIQTQIQAQNMNEDEREVFLSNFKQNPSESFISFGVLGGLFSEGIDLIGDRLIGVVVVGVGLPKISFERSLIKNYFDKKNSMGYEYAYIYPGIIKVLQAAGRVIRTEQDRGIIFLMDSRLMESEYMKLLPNEWWDLKIVDSTQSFVKELNDFWN